VEKRKMFIGSPGMDPHELGAIAVARLLRETGFQLLFMGRFNLPPKIVKVCMPVLSARTPGMDEGAEC
jgi:methylmalonyl-CoA mutase cobalamin-binding subunit